MAALQYSEFKLTDVNVVLSIPGAEDEEEPEQPEQPEKEVSQKWNDNNTRGERLPTIFKKDTSRFIVQLFGTNAEGESASIWVENFKPFFYVLLNTEWSPAQVTKFIKFLKDMVGPMFADNVLHGTIERHRKSRGFDNGAQHVFLKITFNNMATFNKAKYLWYAPAPQQNKAEKNGKRPERKLLPHGLKYVEKCQQAQYLTLYEAVVPPMLRFYHIHNISPSGWIKVPSSKKVPLKATFCKHEYIVNCNDIVPLPHKDDPVPLTCAAWDIETSSSHGDFSVPVKTYKKLATNLVTLVTDGRFKTTPVAEVEQQMSAMIRAAFQVGPSMHGIDVVYPKVAVTLAMLEPQLAKWIRMHPATVQNSAVQLECELEKVFEKMYVIHLQAKNKKGEKEEEEKEEEKEEEDDDDDEKDSDHEGGSAGCFEVIRREAFPCSNSSSGSSNKKRKADGPAGDTQTSLAQWLLSPDVSRETKIQELVKLLAECFPPLEGDKVTFIGTTFTRGCSNEPYLQHCIVLNSCAPLALPNTVIESYNTEAEVLLAWSRLIREQDPDIVYGYNTDNFDYEFMFQRSKELNCAYDFLKMSRNVGELCGKVDFQSSRLDIERSLIVLSTGAYDLSVIPMHGRVQIDMLNWFRRTENMTSYKLDYVSSQLIGDVVTRMTPLVEEENRTRVHSRNLTGLQVENCVHFELFNYSRDAYKQGQKFVVKRLSMAEGWFDIEGVEPQPEAKEIRWGMAKDDVTPKDIFRLSNEGPESRAIVAKYCLQDCNLVHYLFNKVDVITSLVEMAKLCSVPMSFLLSRGQTIKLTSYVAKKCREKGVLMPVIDKGAEDDAYEGAIVLEPKCGMYLEDPVGVGDFGSLYPSSMISENLCPSSKVWAKTYDLEGQFVSEEGEKNAQGEFRYDHLPGIDYVDLTFDTYSWIVPPPTAPGARPKKAVKTKTGFKVCRFAQPVFNPNTQQEERAIMPSILEELLKARKDTRKLIPKTSDPFMKNVLDKRQLKIKETANSLYGQLGAKTSSFYEPDIAAATTATGRMLLQFAKRVLETCFHNTEVATQSGRRVLTNAEYIYGDTDSVFFRLNLSDAETKRPIQGTECLALTIEIAQVACNLVSQVLKKPHDFEYEKTYYPLCMIAKKKYSAVKYETSPHKGTRIEQGNVSKRRDNAPIVKDIFGGVMDILMNDRDVPKALRFVHSTLQRLTKGQVPIEKLVITKSLSSSYKSTPPAHKVLADRIAQRDPGNKPASGDRIPFVYIITSNPKCLQGDKIETPSFILENNLSIDYFFYITNQIMNPLLQLFGLMLPAIWSTMTPPRRPLIAQHEIEVRKILEEFADNPDKRDRKLKKMNDAKVTKIVFEKYLCDTRNKRTGCTSLHKWYTPTTSSTSASTSQKRGF